MREKLEKFEVGQTITLEIEDMVEMGLITKAENTMPAHYKILEQPAYEFLTFTDTPYNKAQKDLKRLEKMENRYTESYTIEDVEGKKITIKVPQRLGHLVKEPE